MKLGTLTFDTIEYASRANAVVGIRDSGKSYTATNLAEQLMDTKDRAGGIPITVFDPTGVWRFLRVPAKGKGYPVVVVGGVDGDLPLNPQTIAKVMEGALVGGVSIIIDLSGDLTKGMMRKIVTDSVNVLMAKNAKYGLRHVFLEEAAEFVPQNIGDPQVYAAVERMVRVGGNMGLGVTMVNPRTANLNKSVLELCDNLFLHRQKGKNSLKALKEWFDATGVDEPADLSKSVSRLKSGDLFAWLRDHETPELLHVQAKNSFHPNRRDLQAANGSSTKRVDAGAFIKALRESLPAIEAELKASDPKELRAEIAELKKQLAAKVPAAPAAAAAKGISQEDQVRLRSEGYNAGWAACMKLVVRYRERVNKAWTGTYQKILVGNADWLVNVVLKRDLPTILREVAGDIPKDLLSIWGEIFGADDAALQTAANFKEPAKTETPSAPVSVSAPNLKFAPTGDMSQLPGPEKRIMGSLAWWAAMGFEAPSRPQVAFLAKYSPTSSSFTNPLGALRTQGLISYPQEGAVSLTDAGELQAAVPEGVALDHESLRRAVVDRLDGPQRRILEPLMRMYPEPVARPALAELANYSHTSSSFTNPLGSLRTLSLLTYPSDGQVRAAEWLFAGDVA